MWEKRNPSQLTTTALALALVVLGACGSEPDALAITDDPATTTSDPLETLPFDQPSVSSTTSAAEALTPTSAPASTTTTAPPTEDTTTTIKDTTSTTITPAEMAVESLGEFDIEGYELVWLHDAREETECQQGTLAVQAADGTITHTYDELGQVGGLQMHYGVRGAIALVEFCEEFVQAIHFTNVAVPPENNVPDFVTTTPPDHVFTLFDMGFSNAGWFVAEATMYEEGAEGWNEIVVFDSFDGTMTELAELVGDRTDHFAYDMDFVIPDEWTATAVGPNKDWIHLELPNGDTYVQIEFHEGTYGIPRLAAGEAHVNTFNDEHSVWERLGNGRSRRVQIVPSNEYVISSDTGERYVEVVELGDYAVVIERYIGATVPSWGYETPYLTTELVRIYEDLA